MFKKWIIWTLVSSVWPLGQRFSHQQKGLECLVFSASSLWPLTIWKHSTARIMIIIFLVSTGVQEKCVQILGCIKRVDFHFLWQHNTSDKNFHCVGHLCVLMPKHANNHLKAGACPLAWITWMGCPLYSILIIKS